MKSFRKFGTLSDMDGKDCLIVDIHVSTLGRSILTVKPINRSRFQFINWIKIQYLKFKYR